MIWPNHVGKSLFGGLAETVYNFRRVDRSRRGRRPPTTWRKEKSYPLITKLAGLSDIYIPESDVEAENVRRRL